VPEPTTDARLNEAPVLAGNPFTLKFTVPAKDPKAVTITVYVVCDLPVTVRVLGEAPIEKSATLSVARVV
jgi:hypothetical protein